ncbi:MAG TPA: hypothetical protein VN224_16175 [Xanthomonadales bacterium]|nr:hypothetical protein [Xanthomonadales bacterium]
MRRLILGALVLTGALAASLCFAQARVDTTEDWQIAYPSPCPGFKAGSTHEITYDRHGGRDLWLTGQNYDSIVRVTTSGARTVHALDRCSGPHGIEFDTQHRLWVSLEWAGQIVRLDANQHVQARYDVRLHCTSCVEPLNTHPHGMAFADHGRALWFTGKATGTVGKITLATGRVQTFQLPNVGSVPIYIKEGNDGNMWVTELLGNAIARVTPSGDVKEFTIPTANSRPIAIVPEPGGRAMWFSEEAGNKVARIDPSGTITEFAVANGQANVKVILAGLAFDGENDLWVQQYVPHGAPNAGVDSLIEIDKKILTAKPSDNIPMTPYRIPTTDSVMHRIIQGPDGAMWYTEMMADKVGKVTRAEQRKTMKTRHRK